MTKAEEKFYKKPIAIDQTPGFCGPACLKSILHFYNTHEELEDIAKNIGATEEHGIEAEDLLSGAKKYNLKGYIKNNSSFKEVEKLLKENYQIIVEWFSNDDSHYSVVSDINDTEIEIMDPSVGEYKIITQKEFAPIWFTFPKDNHKKPVDKRIIVLWKEKDSPEKRMDKYKKHKNISDKDVVTKEIGEVYGYKVNLVDGNLVRQKFDTDFVMGGNPGRYSYVPNNTIWIESHYEKKELIPILIHEIIECEHMIYDGDNYEKAHGKATKHESVLRKEPLKTLQEAEKYISGVFGKNKKSSHISELVKIARLFKDVYNQIK
jgi:predicted double-glycine peptidase